MEDNTSNKANTPRLEDVADDSFDADGLVLRRADPDDCNAIINLVDIGEDDLYNRVFAYPKVLMLIETSYLAITVIDRDSGTVIGFAAFEDYPCGIRGLVDDRHYNYWEKWLSLACNVNDFSSANSLWLSYFVLSSAVPLELTHCVFKEVLHTIYTSNPNLIGILFMARGDADEGDLKRCFQPISRFFQKLEVQNESVLQAIRGIHPASQFYFTSRMHVLPFIEIRRAHQEDHDDLTDVFNSQSETVTEAYGEYFIAELIAVQNDNNCALVAQVKDKAVGLMGLTREIDLQLLQKCFKLDTFDNLLKPDFMEAVRERRKHLQVMQSCKEKNKALAARQNFENELLRSNVIAQRMEMQEHLLRRGDEIIKVIDEYLQNEEEAKEVLSQHFVTSRLFADWLGDFEIHQPNELFLESPFVDSDLPELEYNVLSELDFLMSTLEIFGLPQDYINGNGHHLNWRDKSAEEKKKKKGKKKAKAGGAAAKLAHKMGVGQKEEQVKPTHFDLAPFQKALRRFLACGPEQRSNIRCTLQERFIEVRSVFKDKTGELSFKRVVDIHEMVDHLNECGFNFDGLIGETLGSILLCFGGIGVNRHWGDRPPPETDEQKRSKANLNFLLGERGKVEDEKRKKMKRGESVMGPQGQILRSEDEKTQEELELQQKISELQEKIKPKKLIKVALADTSIDDLIECLREMQAYDRLLTRCQLTKPRDWAHENKILEKAKMPWVEHFSLLPDVLEEAIYSDDLEIQSICQGLTDADTIPDVPESAKNAFAITLFCMDSAFDCRSKDFLKYAFEAFPERDYLIVTQPHTVAESALLNKFTLVQKQSINTFQHVLYIFHRDYLFEEDMSVCRSLPTQWNGIQTLIESSGENGQLAQDTIALIRSATQHENASPYTSFTATVLDQVVATLLLSRDVNLDYYVSHFHLQDQLLLGEHDRTGHARLVYAIINPIFERSTRWLIKEALRLAGKTCIYFEVNDATVIPQIFHELIHVRCRRFPHFLNRKWDHEHQIAGSGDLDGGASCEQSSTQGDGVNQFGQEAVAIDGAERNAIDEDEAPFALCFQSKRLLSEQKIQKNGRIVVVGASDTGISFVEALLSITYLQFTNITLVAPGGLPHRNLARRQANLKAASTSYTYEELKKLMLESRVSVIDARMKDIDRSDKNIILHDGSVLPYDTLVLAMGIQEKTLTTLGYVSQGIAPLPEGAVQARGVLSIDDPFLYKYLASDGHLMDRLTDRRRQTNVVIYGRSLNSFTLVQGLLDRGVQPKCITLAVPRAQCHVNEVDADAQIDEDMPWINPNAFEDSELHEKIEKSLMDRGVSVLHECRLMEIITDRELTNSRPNTHRRGNGDQSEARNSGRTSSSISLPNLQKILLKRLDIPEEEEEEDEFEQEEMGERSDEDAAAGVNSGANGPAGADESGLLENDEASRSERQEKRKKRKKNELELDCGVLVTCGHRDVDQDVFNAIHNNGLVYNGRLIVDKHFQTTDKSVFAAGTLCEFSNKYLSLVGGRSLRMDRYNGREMGARLARSVFDLYDPQSALNQGEGRGDEDVPLFYLPQGSGGILPKDLIYYHIRTTNPLYFGPQQADFKNRPDLVCDNLDLGTGLGTYLKFTFNSIGLIDSVTYMGNEEVILQSLWSFVGLHENYLNQLFSRFEANVIPCTVEFLSENWAIALYHEWFGDFCLRMRHSVKGLTDVQQLLHQSLELSKSGLGLTREQLQQLRSNMSTDSQRLIEDETLEFIKTNMNHLPMYYIPGQEFK